MTDFNKEEIPWWWSLIVIVTFFCIAVSVLRRCEKDDLQRKAEKETHQSQIRKSFSRLSEDSETQEAYRAYDKTNNYE